jgi:hypothetical protein
MFIVGVFYEVKQVLCGDHVSFRPSVRPSVTQYQAQTVHRIVIKFKSSLQKL